MPGAEVAALLLFLLSALLSLLLLLVRRRDLQHPFQQITHMIQVVACLFMVGVAFKHPFVCRDRLFECGNGGLVIAQRCRLLGDLRHRIGVIVRGVDTQ